MQANLHCKQHYFECSSDTKYAHTICKILLRLVFELSIHVGFNGILMLIAASTCSFDEDIFI